MATGTLKPNATASKGAWNVVGAATPHAALSDGSEVSYVTPSQGAWLFVVDLEQLVMPEFSFIKAVDISVKRAGNSLAKFDVSVGYQPAYGRYQTALLSSGEKPSSVIATKNYGSLTLAPGGLPWDNNSIIRNLQVSLGAGDPAIKVYEITVTVTYSTLPKCVVLAPLGNIVGSQVPGVEFTYDDVEKSTLEKFQVRVFTEDQVNTLGFSPDTSGSFWDSGTIISSSPFTRITRQVEPGDYVIYVRASGSAHQGKYGPWASGQFSMTGALPITPLVTVTAQSSFSRNRIVAVQQDNYLPFATASMNADNGDGDGWYPDYNTTLANKTNVASTSSAFSETFTGPDGVLSATNTDYDWEVVTGDFTVIDGRLRSSTVDATSSIRLVNALSSKDHWMEQDVDVLSTQFDRSANIQLRYDASTNTCYYIGLNQLYNRYAVWYMVNGVKFPISGFRALPEQLILPAVWRAEVQGSRITVYLNGVKLYQVTDTHITTGVRVGGGFWNGGNNVRVAGYRYGTFDPVVPSLPVEPGEWLLEMTAGAAGQVMAHSGGGYGWATPVRENEEITIMASCWQGGNQARSFWLDAHYNKSDGTRLTNAVFDEQWTGTNGSQWGSNWSRTMGTNAFDDIQSNAGRLTTGTQAYTAPARMYASGMPSMAACEVLVKVRPGNLTAESRGIVALRTNNTWSGANPGHPAQGYWVEFDLQNSLFLVRKGSTASTVLGNVPYTYPTDINEGVWLRFRCLNTNIAVKLWGGFEKEKAEWDYIGNDSTWTSGKISITCQNGASAVARSYTFDELWVDDLTKMSTSSPATTSTGSTMVETKRNLTVPAGAVDIVLSLVAFANTGGEKFYWSQAGVMPGHDREWGRGGLQVANFYGANEGTFENSSAGVAGWDKSANTILSRDVYVTPASRAAIKLNWDGTQSGIPKYIQAIGPGKPAFGNLDYVIRAWLQRATFDTTLLRLGLLFKDSSGNVMGQGFSNDALPDPENQWTEAKFTMKSPPETAWVHATYITTPLVVGSGAGTRFEIREGTDITDSYRPGPAAHSVAYVEYSDDGGTTWVAVKFTGFNRYVAGTATIYDYEAPQSVERLYRVSTYAIDYKVNPRGGAFVSSTPSSSVGATLSSIGWLLKDPSVPGSLLRLNVKTPFSTTSEEPQEKHTLLGREHPVIRSDVVKSKEMVLDLRFYTDEDFSTFEAMRSRGTTLLLQRDDGIQYYIKLGPNLRVEEHETKNRLNGKTLRFVSIEATDVGRP